MGFKKPLSHKADCFGGGVGLTHSTLSEAMKQALGLWDEATIRVRFLRKKLSKTRVGHRVFQGEPTLKKQGNGWVTLYLLVVE